MPGPVSSAVGLTAEVWRHRSIVASMWRTETRARYANSAAGVLWALIAPLALIAVYVVVFSALLDSRLLGPVMVSGGFGFFIMSGMIPWLVVSQAAASAPGSLLAHGPTVRRFAIPPSLVPAQLVLTSLTDGAVTGLMFAVVLMLSGRLQLLRLPALVPAIVALTLFVAGLALAVSALNLYGRDVGQAVSAFLPFLFFATPIVYPAEALPELLQAVLAANPLTGILQAFRWALVSGPAPSAALSLYSTFAALAVFAAGAHLFQETRGDFADLL